MADDGFSHSAILPELSTRLSLMPRTKHGSLNTASFVEGVASLMLNCRKPQAQLAQPWNQSVPQLLRHDVPRSHAKQVCPPAIGLVRHSCGTGLGTRVRLPPFLARHALKKRNEPITCGHERQPQRSGGKEKITGPMFPTQKTRIATTEFIVRKDLGSTLFPK